MTCALIVLVAMWICFLFGFCVGNQDNEKPPEPNSEVMSKKNKEKK
jgi:hypothetical protein